MAAPESGAGPAGQHPRVQPLRELLRQAPRPLVVPTVFNGLSAQVAQAAGFQALYLGGGPLGYMNGGLEANLGLMDVADQALRIRSVSPLPLIMDGVCGWGDPMHVQRSVAVGEAAGFCAMEIEDQWLPKRAHHHVRIEKMIPQRLMEQKVAAAVDARRSADFLIIARTNAVRNGGVDEAVRRLEAYHRNGADLLFCMPRTAEEARFIAARLPAPLVYMPPDGGLESCCASPEELAALGYRLLLLANAVMAALFKAMVDTYASLKAGRAIPALHGVDLRDVLDELNACAGLARMLDIERKTVGAGEGNRTLV
jgi:2-methylisocitrate lyase-like PEP mutase family enzyme